jgi:VWFA-related protein
MNKRPQMKSGGFYLVPLILLCSSFIFAQSGSNKREVLEPDGTIKIDTALVLVDGIVVSKKTKTVIGDLRREDFVIRENGKPQAITHFSREELPLSIVLLVDVSGSVRPIIDQIQSASLDALSELKPADRVGLMIFANKAKLIAELTTDHDQVSGKFGEIWNETGEIGSGTFITTGIYEAERYLRRKTAASDRRAIILITDDEDFRNHMPSREVVLNELYESGTTLCGIVVGRGKNTRRAVTLGATAAITAINPALGGVLIGMNILRRATSPGSTSHFFSEKTGGVTVGAKTDGVGDAFIGMVQLLRTRYTFGYEPPAHPDDGKLRTIKLEVHSEVQRQKGRMNVFARRGYYLKPAGSRQ